MPSWSRIAGVFAGLLLMAAPAAADESVPLAIYGNKQTLEITPVLVAADEIQPDAPVKMGGIPNLVGEPGAAGFSEPGEADLATNAETQLLRASVKHPELRIVLGVSEGLYRIVARRSAGITDIADLRGKRVATIAPTSAGYFLERMLRRADLSLEDVHIVPIVPLSGMTEALRKGEVDAVAIWEPEAAKSARLLGNDLVEFSGEGAYRELFNLNTTAAKLADPATRARIVRFVRRVMDVTAALNADPAPAQALVASAGNFGPGEVAAGWPHHRFIATIPADLLDVMTEEEQWLASRDKRPVRSREELARLIDTGVYHEALALGERR
jgi:NitT/TauT family transport system substrate-binding protein